YLVIAHPTAGTALEVLAAKAGLGNRQIDRTAAPQPPAGYIILGPLGAEGASKEVFLGAAEVPGAELDSLVALKRYKGESNIAQDAMAPNLLIRRHANVSQSTLRKTEAGEAWLVEELWKCSLAMLVEKQGPLRDLDEIFNISTQLFSGLLHIHAQRVRHTDIKPENCGILQFGRDQPMYVIGDFGLLSSQPDVLPSRPESRGALKTRPPEMFAEPKRIGLGSDVWSLGATLFALCTTTYPLLLGTEIWDGPGDPRRARIESEISADLDRRVTEFKGRLQVQLPPVLRSPLAMCFDEFDVRRPAAHIHRELEDAWKLLRERPEGARWAWQRAEDLHGAYRRVNAGMTEPSPAISAEAEEIVTNFQTEIPSHLYDELSAMVR